MADDNVLQKLKTALQDLSKFLNNHIDDLKGLIQSVGKLFPPIVDVIGALKDLLTKLKKQVDDIHLDTTALDKIKDFAPNVTKALGAIKDFRPDLTGNVDDVGKVVQAVSELPSLNDLKGELSKAIQEVIDALDKVKGGA